MKKLNLFILPLLLILGACDQTPTEPNVPPESIVIVTIPFVEVTTTTTTANIKSTVNTNGATSIAVEYGVGNYSNSTNAVPATFKVNTVVNTEISNLIPNTRYQFRIKATTGTKNVVQYLADSSFTTKSEPVVVTVSSTEISVTATTANIKSTVNTNGATSIAVEYGISDYSNSGNFIPNSFSTNTTINAKLTGLTLNTRYQFRIKSTTNGASKYLVDSTFTTSSQLQIGDTWNKGVVISLNPKLLAAPVDQSDSTRGLTLAEAIEACKNYGGGYRLPDSTELKIMLNAKNAGIIKNFVGPKFSPAGPYLSCTVSPGNLNWVFFLGFNGGQKGWVPIDNYLYARAVCSF